MTTLVPTRSTPMLSRPLARIVVALAMLWMMLFAIFWLVDMCVLTYQGLVLGQWYIDASDFHLTIYLQIILSLITIGASLTGMVAIIRSARTSDVVAYRRLALTLAVCVIAFFAIYAAHHWFEILICTKGTIPSECTLYFKP
jgi:hypothetical protein